MVLQSLQKKVVVIKSHQLKNVKQKNRMKQTFITLGGVLLVYYLLREKIWEGPKK